MVNSGDKLNMLPSVVKRHKISPSTVKKGNFHRQPSKMPININRQEVLRYLKSHYFRSSSRDNGSLRGSKREKPVLMFSKTVFLDIASRDRTTCLYLKVSRSILKSLIWTKFLIFDRRHHKGDDAVDWRKFGFLYIFKTDSSLRPHLNILILGLNFHLIRSPNRQLKL